MATAAPARPFCRCACFYSENLFVARYGLHLRFRSERQLRRDYGAILLSRGCVSNQDFQQVLAELEQEVQRRRRLGQESAARRALIASSYHPARPEVYSSLQDAALAPEFLAAAEYSASPGADLKGLLQRLQTVSEEKRIYRLPVFTAAFCQALLEELEHFERSDMPKGRPNTMNNYGTAAGAAWTATEPSWSSTRQARTASWAVTTITRRSPSTWPWARPSREAPCSLGATSGPPRPRRSPWTWSTWWARASCTGAASCTGPGPWAPGSAGTLWSGSGPPPCATASAPCASASRTCRTARASATASPGRSPPPPRWRVRADLSPAGPQWLGGLAAGALHLALEEAGINPTTTATAGPEGHVSVRLVLSADRLASWALLAAGPAVLFVEGASRHLVTRARPAPGRGLPWHLAPGWDRAGGQAGPTSQTAPRAPWRPAQSTGVNSQQPQVWGSPWPPLDGRGGLTAEEERAGTRLPGLQSWFCQFPQCGHRRSTGPLCPPR